MKIDQNLDPIEDNLLYPSKTYREKYCSTRKHHHQLPAGIDLPGLFSTSGFDSDKRWFYIAMGIEALALFLTVRGGISRGGNWIWLSILIATFFILFDIVGAWLSHHNERNKTILRNQSAIANDREAKQGFINESKKITLRQIMGVSLIVFSSFLKYVALFLLGTFIAGILIIAATLYLVVIYIHVYHTGFYLAEIRRRSQLKSDIKAHQLESMLSEAERKEILSPLRAQIQTSGSEEYKDKLRMTNGQITVGQNKIIEEIREGVAHYQLHVKGLLTDDLILRFIEGQNDDQTRFIVKLCIKFQLTHQIN